IYIYINDDETSRLWTVAEYDSKLATPSIPHVFNPNCIIINLFNNRFVSTVFNHVLLVPTSGF
ncbi:hypothetical protein T07_10643, partial [Trichinella nelsoni]